MMPRTVCVAKSGWQEATAHVLLTEYYRHNDDYADNMIMCGLIR